MMLSVVSSNRSPLCVLVDGATMYVRAGPSFYRGNFGERHQLCLGNFPAVVVFLSGFDWLAPNRETIKCGRCQCQDVPRASITSSSWWPVLFLEYVGLISCAAMYNVVNHGVRHNVVNHGVAPMTALSITAHEILRRLRYMYRGTGTHLDHPSRSHAHLQTWIRAGKKYSSVTLTFAR